MFVYSLKKILLNNLHIWSCGKGLDSGTEGHVLIILLTFPDNLIQKIFSVYIKIIIIYCVLYTL